MIFVELVQFIIEFPCEILNNGKSVTIEQINSSEKQQPSGNIEDLYNKSNERKDIHIQIPKESIEKGKTILIQKDNILIKKSDDHQKEQKYHLTNNQFFKRDHLQSKSYIIFNISIQQTIFI